MKRKTQPLDHLTNPIIGFAVEKGSLVVPEPVEIGNPAINAINISKQRQEDQCNLLNSPKSPILVQPLTYYDNNHTVSHNLMQGNEDDLTKCDNGKSIQINRSVAETTNTNHGGESDIELRHSSVWYRFGPSTSNISQDSNYIAQVSDASCEREFYNIIGKEDIDGEVHYLVDWTPTLIRGEILKEAKAQPLIDRFEIRCQSQKAALGFEYNPPPHHQNFNENLPKKRQHKKVAIGETREDDENKRAQDRWEQKQWQQGNISDTDHLDDSSPDSSVKDDKFRPAKRRKVPSMPTNYDLTPPHKHNKRHRLRQRHTLATLSIKQLDMDKVQPQGLDGRSPMPIDKHHRYPLTLSKSSGIISNNTIYAGISTRCDNVVHSKVQKAKPLSTCSVVIYSKVQPLILRTKRNSARWTSSENKTLLRMKKSGCSWEEIHNTLPHRTQGAIQVQYSTKLKK
ncbi:hypothetical protein ACHAQE_011012 [Botrytis cinerea]